MVTESHVDTGFSSIPFCKGRVEQSSDLFIVLKFLFVYFIYFIFPGKMNPFTYNQVFTFFLILSKNCHGVCYNGI